MRVLIVSDRLPPDVRSGAGSVLADLADLLGAEHDVELVRGSGTGAKARARLEVEVLAAHRRLRPDVALSLGPSLAGLSCPVLRLGGPDESEPAPGALASLRRQVRRKRLRSAITVVPTAPSAQLLAKDGASIVCPPGLDCRRFQSAPVSDEPLRIVFVGRFVPSRGAHIALEAFNGLPGWALDRARLDLVGASGEPRYLDTLRRKADGLPCTVHTDVPDVAPFLAGAALAILPSTAEDGWGRAILEAMACGVPVVSSKGGVIEALTGGCAELVPAGNLKAVGDAVRRLLRSEERRAELGAAARAHALKNHDWDVVLPRWVEALERATR